MTPLKTEAAEPIGARTVANVALIRLLIGLGQGLLLYHLRTTTMANDWPLSDAAVARALLAVVIFVPVTALFSLGVLRPRTLALWLAVVACLCVGLGLHSQWREAPVPIFYPFLVAPVFPALALLFFIGQALVSVADRTGSRDLRPQIFRVYWRQATQLLFAGFFAIVSLWVFGACTTLFGAPRSFHEPIFTVLVTTTAFAGAMHLAITGEKALADVQQFAANVFAGLMLPILLLVASVFLGTMLFRLNMTNATATLLGMAFALVVMINSPAASTGASDVSTRKFHRPLEYFHRIAILMLILLLVVAAVALGLRVEQYGWTPARIIAASGVAALGLHAVGYAAALRSGRTLLGLASTNTVAAGAICLLLVALMTPLADPARLTVADQIHRLETGRIAARNFDYHLLYWRSAIYGWQALERLTKTTDGPDADLIAKKAKEAHGHAYGSTR